MALTDARPGLAAFRPVVDEEDGAGVPRSGGAQLLFKSSSAMTDRPSRGPDWLLALFPFHGSTAEGQAQLRPSDWSAVTYHLGWGTPC